MNVLVTGATGFIGRHLIERLTKADGSIGDVSLLDFAPTFLTLVGGPFQQKLTGRVIDQMINGKANLCRKPMPRQEATEVR